MSDLALFSLASRRLSWLTTRQTVVAENIANAHVAGYRAREVRPFADVLGRAGMTLATTQPGHLGAGPAGDVAAGARIGEVENGEVRFSGNTVQLDQELLKAGAVSAEAALSTGIVRAFHRLLMATTKG